MLCYVNMNDIAKVSNIGKINILEVCIGDDIEHVKSILSKNHFKISEEPILFQDFVRLSIEVKEQNGLPDLSILFDFKHWEIHGVQKWLLKTIIIKGKNGLCKSEYDKCFSYFKSILKDFVVVSEEECSTLWMKNNLQTVSIIGYSKAGQECIYFHMMINGNLDKICRLCENNENLTEMDGYSKGIKIEIVKILRIVGIILVLILAYLFVLNDRYYITQKSYFDKWTKTMYYLDIDEGKWDVVTKE